MNLEQATAAYVKIRDHIDKSTKAHTAAMRPYRDKLIAIENAILKSFDATGQESAKTPSGTPYIGKFTSVKVQDREAYLAWVLENNALQFLESKANKSAVNEYVEEHGEPPVGVSIDVTRTINVRRS